VPLPRDRSSESVAAAFKEYIEGIRYLLEHKGILVIASLKAVNSLATGAFQVIQVVLAEQIYVIGEGGSTSLGLLYAVVGAGTGFGPIWARKFTGDRNRSMRIAIAVSYLIATTGLLLVAPLPGFILVLVGTFLRGLGGGVNWVFSTQLLLQLVPNRVRGRVFSTEYALMTLASAAAAYLGGWGMDNPSFGISKSIWGMAAITVFFGLLWTLWLVLNKHTRESESDLTPQ
jgi:predicted MFS family arabinose efflux permease